MKSSTGIAERVSRCIVPREPSSIETRATDFSSGASMMFTKSKRPSTAHCAFTVTPSCSISLLTSRIRDGLLFSVCTPSGVRVLSITYVGNVLPFAVTTRRNLACWRDACAQVGSGRMRLLRAAVALASVVVAAPATASAQATLTVDPVRDCYLEQDQVFLLAQGYTPNGRIDFTRGGDLVGEPVTADAPRAFQGTLTPPRLLLGPRPPT